MRATGTCQHCRREQPLDDGRHVAAHDYLAGQLACTGSGQLAAEVKAANAETSRAKAMARIERLRAEAMVAHDAMLIEHSYPAHRLLALCAAALQEYRINHPKSRTRRLWFFEGRSGRSRWRAARADVYCTLCRQSLVQNAVRGADYTARTSEHTTLCALQRLAGMAAYGDPGKLELPADASPEVEA